MSDWATERLLRWPKLGPAGRSPGPACARRSGRLSEGFLSAVSHLPLRSLTVPAEGPYPWSYARPRPSLTKIGPRRGGLWGFVGLKAYQRQTDRPRSHFRRSGIAHGAACRNRTDDLLLRDNKPRFTRLHSSPLTCGNALTERSYDPLGAVSTATELHHDAALMDAE